MTNQTIPSSLRLRAGELVEVRSKEEILSTLDRQGQLEAMPFMPEMLQYCGQRYKVGKRAHKTCDPVNGLGGRKMNNAVHLEGLRCDGSDHDECQAGCLFYWKESWLRRVDGDSKPGQSALESLTGGRGVAEGSGTAACTVADLQAATREKATGDPAQTCTYICQATRVAAATQPLPWWDVRQYVEDYTSGNVTLFQMFSSFLFVLYHGLAGSGLGIGSGMRWIYDVFQRLRGGAPYPLRPGRVPKGSRTPSLTLDLQPGELVRMKSYHEILETLDENWRNRGLYFDAEMVPFTDRTFRVLKRVQRIIDEKSGKMLNLKTEPLILENVVCEARYARCRKFCPRGYYQYAREIWLERVSDDSGPVPGDTSKPAQTKTDK